MQVTNELVSDSFQYMTRDKDITERMEEVILLDQILSFCQKIGEKVLYDDTFMEIEVSEGVCIRELLEYSSPELFSGEHRDEYSFLVEMIHKKCMLKAEDGDNRIFCSCGEHSGAASTLREYVHFRQTFLEKIKNHDEFNSFMRTCFPNTTFSNECENELGYIKKFASHAKEITRMLAVLDENAIEVYERCMPDSRKALAEIQALAKRECSNDPDHKDTMNFEFECDDKSVKSVECQPHLKLIRKDSDLRIYFYWKDANIGSGERVLIGRIGRHTW